MDDAFNYVAVLVSIIIGLGVTKVLSQLSEALQVDVRRRTYWVHTLWMVSFLTLLLLCWWVFYRWHHVRDWTFFLFLWVNVAPILQYLASGVLCPGGLETTDAANWHDYYYANRRSFFFIFALIWPLDIVDTLLKGKQHFVDQGPLYLPTMLAWCTGAIVAGLTKNERYHAFWAIFFLLYQIYYTTVVLLRLG